MYKFVLARAIEIEKVMNDYEKAGYKVVSVTAGSLKMNPEDAPIYVAFHKEGK